VRLAIADAAMLQEQNTLGRDDDDEETTEVNLECT
jgi:hypothetical protein